MGDLFSEEVDIGLVGNCLRKEMLSLVAETDVYYIVFASAHHKRYQPLSHENENLTFWIFLPHKKIRCAQSVKAEFEMPPAFPSALPNPTHF